MNVALGIAIPTYKRVQFFSRLTQQLSREVTNLPLDLQEQISITIFENPSEYSDEKERNLSRLNFGRAKLTWNINKENIGGDVNIEQAYNSNLDCTFNWVIGDDEQLISSCLREIYDYLADNHKCGLVLLRDPGYKIHEKILDANRWSNYEEFVKFVADIQPHLILAHTLISANIVNSEVYCISASRQERLLYAPRADLRFSFSHMKAILTGLSQRDDLSVNLLLKPCIDVSDRAAPENANDLQLNSWQEMKRLYRHHLYWIGAEFGVDIESIRQHPSMIDIYRDTKDTNYFRKAKKTLKRARRLLSNIFRSTVKTVTCAFRHRANRLFRVEGNKPR